MPIINNVEPGFELRSRSAARMKVRRRAMLIFTSALLVLFVTAETTATFAKPRAASPAGDSDAGQAIIFNEGPASSQGERHDGHVSWRIIRDKTSGGQKEIAVHGDVEIPDLDIHIKIDMKQNTDKSLPASHVVELSFAVPPGRDIISVPGLLMKITANARGVPLAGLGVEVTKNVFLVGLSNVSADRKRNMQLLAERRWMDVPFVYASQHRGILALEKGFHGEDVFHEAMAAWGESP